MNLLKTIRNTDVGLEAPLVPVDIVKVRKAARAVILMDGKVALMHATRDRYFKLPGGGIESSDGPTDTTSTIVTALAREAKEEVGAEITVTQEVGKIIEIREDEGFQQESFCFIAQQIGELTDPELTEKELEAGFELFWANDINHAIQLVDDASPENGGGKFMKARDGEFLRSARQLLHLGQ